MSRTQQEAVIRDLRTEITSLEAELDKYRTALRDNNAVWAGQTLNFEIAKRERDALEAENAKLRAVVSAAKDYFTEDVQEGRTFNPKWFTQYNAVKSALEALETTNG